MRDPQMAVIGALRGVAVVTAMVLGAAGIPAAEAAHRPRNVILMIADGAGYNARLAASMWAGTKGHEFHDRPGWVRVGVSTYALRETRATSDPGADLLRQNANLVYDPAKAWDPTPVAGWVVGQPFRFAGYRWLNATRPDSANTATSISTGKKTYVGAINVDGAGTAIEETIAELAHRAGKRVGVVSSVPFNHATPAAFGGAHHVSRAAYCSIAIEMLTDPRLDLVAGCGHPEFDNNGEPLEDTELADYRWVGGREVWNHLQGRTPLSAGAEVCTDYPGESRTIRAAEIAELDRWTRVETRQAVDALRKGATPERLMMVPRCGKRMLWWGDPDSVQPARANLGATLQAERGSRADPRFTDPGYDPRVQGVPTLVTMTQAALNVLDDGPEGLFLMIEGGAVDWAMHDRALGRMIEEFEDFDRSVDAVIAWIAEHGGWDANLLIVTADHGHMLFGPHADTRAFDPLVGREAGRLPFYRWISSMHSNALVPLFARGAGVDAIERLATRTDPVRGRYLDQTEIYEALRKAVGGPNEAGPIRR